MSLRKKREDRKDDRIEHLIHPEEGQNKVFDFSQNGIGLYLDHPLKSGEKCKAKVEVGDLTLTVAAKAAHCTIFGKQYRVGFQYLDVNDKDKVTLKEMSDRYGRGVSVRIQLL